MPDDSPHTEASLTCRGCGYAVYFNHAGDGTAVYRCLKCGEIHLPRIVPFYFRNPACPGCGRQFSKEDHIPASHMRPGTDTVPCPRCKRDRMDLKNHLQILFWRKGLVPAVGQIIHAHVDRELSLYPGEPYLFVPDMASGHCARLADGAKPLADGHHRLRVISIQKGKVKPGDLRRITVEHIGPISEDELWNNEAPL